MKKICLITLSFMFALSSFAQPVNELNTNLKNDASQSILTNRKAKGYYNLMQFSLLFGNKQVTDQVIYYQPYDYDAYPLIDYANISTQANTHSELTAIPSFTITNGYMFNEHWAAGVGVGFEIFDHNLYPLFAELRYTFWDDKISPFIVLKGGHSFGSFKAKHYDELYLDWSPYSITDCELRNYGGLMFNPEVGVKVPLNENSDLLFTAAYRHQKTKSTARKDYGNNQFDEWEHKEDLNRLSFGVAIMFR
ncbi:hypothetical protein [Draconibacterium sp.]|uniref:hypothetical protein n=1 Tax=Draconibacterium sp. TaxID=1965318 RepID=UPI0025EBD3A5|nr:hypothetical protein [uncultured Draconibacterium sp.]